MGGQPNTESYAPIRISKGLVRRALKRGASNFLALLATIRTLRPYEETINGRSSITILRAPSAWFTHFHDAVEDIFKIGVLSQRGSIYAVLCASAPSTGRTVDVDLEKYLRTRHLIVIAEPGARLPVELEISRNLDADLDFGDLEDFQALGRIRRSGPIHASDLEVLRDQPPTVIDVIFRQNQSARAAIERLTSLKSARGTLAEDPSLHTLPGYGEVGRWGRDLAIDIDLWRLGKLSWSDIDKGMLLHGPPGTGKTYFAKALAVTCKMTLVSASLGKWQAMGHLGDTLKAMGKSFAEAKRKAPSILFLDEIDAIGDRDEFIGENAFYCTEVVNALLEHLDGSADRDGVIVVGACNEANKIDRAILRAGRLEKHVFFDKPDQPARKEILAYYHPEIESDESISNLAERLKGWSHADLNRLSREAKKVARRDSRAEVTVEDLLAGLPDKRPILPEQLLRLAVHEAGHGVVALSLGRELEYITISRDFDDADQSTTLGSAKLTEKGPLLKVESDISVRIAVYMAGSAAEEVFFHERSTSAGGAEASDFVRATELARLLVAEYGLGRRLSVVPKGTATDVRRDHHLRMEVEEILRRQYEVAKEIVERSKDAVRALADMLVRDGHIPGKQASEVYESHRAVAKEPSATMTI